MKKINKLDLKYQKKLLDVCNRRDLYDLKKLIKKENFSNENLYFECLNIVLSYSFEPRFYYLMEYALILGANPRRESNYGTPDNNYSRPLLSAIIEGDYEYANDIDNFETEEEMDIYLRDIKTYELLIQYGADINEAGEEGYTPLDTAVMIRHKYAEKLLKKLGAKYSKRFIDEEYKKFYPEKDSSKEDFIETKWINKRLPPIHREIKRETSNFGVFSNNITLGFLPNKIMNNEQPINQKDYLGRTAVDYAIELGHHLAVDYLRSVGGKTSKELDNKE